MVTQHSYSVIKTWAKLAYSFRERFSGFLGGRSAVTLPHTHFVSVFGDIWPRYPCYGAPVRFQEVGSNLAPKQWDREKIAQIQVLTTAFTSGGVFIFSKPVRVASTRAATVCGLWRNKFNIPYVPLAQLLYTHVKKLPTAGAPPTRTSHSDARGIAHLARDAQLPSLSVLRATLKSWTMLIRHFSSSSESYNIGVKSEFLPGSTVEGGAYH